MPISPSLSVRAGAFVAMGPPPSVAASLRSIASRAREAPIAFGGMWLILAQASRGAGNTPGERFRATVQPEHAHALRQAGNSGSTSQDRARTRLYRTGLRWSRCARLRRARDQPRRA